MIKFVCDKKRHLVCLPFSIDNLHKMAKELGINKSFYHPKGRLKHPHYDIPVKKISEIHSKCIIVSQRTILKIIKGEIIEL